MKQEPDFERMRRAIFCQEADRVPLAELQVDQEIRDAFLGKLASLPANFAASTIKMTFLPA